MIFRNWRSASSMPAAVQRSAISPEDQRLTLRWVRRTISIIDSHGLVLSSVRLSEPVTPSQVSVSVSSERYVPIHGGSLLLILDGSPRTLPTEADEAGGTAVKFYELRDNLSTCRRAMQA